MKCLITVLGLCPQLEYSTTIFSLQFHESVNINLTSDSTSAVIQCTSSVLRQENSVLGMRSIVETLTTGDVSLESNSVSQIQPVTIFSPRGRETETGEVWVRY